MAAALVRYERRDGADRAAMGVAAFNLCRAARHQGARSSRFFWTSADSIVILSEADSAHLFDDEPKPELAQALFALADLARQVSNERWIDPRDGESTYHTAGR
ncbi:MAG TPA: hypothetical protein VE990_13080 [Acidimicrobiales bacterium]|nr:hypothetical protein [Acidimicrobiales bacterium]